MELIMTMRAGRGPGFAAACVRRSGSIAWVTAMWPKKFTSNWRFHSSTGTSSAGRLTLMPALLTSAARPAVPVAREICSAAAWMVGDVEGRRDDVGGDVRGFLADRLGVGGAANPG